MCASIRKVGERRTVLGLVQCRAVIPVKAHPLLSPEKKRVFQFRSRRNADPPHPAEARTRIISVTKEGRCCRAAALASSGSSRPRFAARGDDNNDRGEGQEEWGEREEGRRGVAGGSHGDALLRGRRSDIKKITHDEADSSFFFSLFGSRREPWRDKQANGLAVSCTLEKEYFEIFIECRHTGGRTRGRTRTDYHSHAAVRRTHPLVAVSSVGQMQYEHTLCVCVWVREGTRTNV